MNQGFFGAPGTSTRNPRGTPLPMEMLLLPPRPGFAKSVVAILPREIAAPPFRTELPHFLLPVPNTRWETGAVPYYGALLLSEPDGTILGGNARGNGAIDLQWYRVNAAQVASGTESVVIGNGSHTASGNNSVAVGGGEAGQNRGHTTSGSNSGAFAGRSHTVTAIGAGAICGFSSSVSGEYSIALAGFDAAVAGFYAQAGGLYPSASQYGQSAHSAGRFATTGDAQRADLSLRREITGTGATRISLDGATTYPDLGTANRLWACRLTVAASINTVGTGTPPLAVGDSWIGVRYFAIKRVTNDAGTALIGAVETLGTDKADANMAGFAIAITADTTNGTVNITATPCTLAGGTTKTRISAHLELTELGI